MKISSNTLLTRKTNSPQAKQDLILNTLNKIANLKQSFDNNEKIDILKELVSNPDLAGMTHH